MQDYIETVKIAFEEAKQQREQMAAQYGADDFDEWMPLL